ncbi:MAG: hypothetical protein CTY28_01125 [Hyphomicrobium sp.]|nr:MAG: hypothetical protein CTY28_01125 [Hyphomicrobium sp.]
MAAAAATAVNGERVSARIKDRLLSVAASGPSEKFCSTYSHCFALRPGPSASSTPMLFNNLLIVWPCDG